MSSPAVVLLFCGKRKSGKDYVVNLLKQELSEEVCEVLRLSEPLKSDYAKEHGLDLAKLLDSSDYKEQFRSDMISWGEVVRAEDPGYFCRRACEAATKPIWIISDARRLSDMEYFKERYTTLTVRVTAADAIRRGRGWVFTSGVDNAPSECALDGYTCDMEIDNNGNPLKAPLKVLTEKAMTFVNKT